MLKTSLCALAVGAVAMVATPASAQKVTDIPWGTSAVGSSGHRALVQLATVLNREMPQYRVTAQPTPGAIISVKGYATGQFLGFYGSDVAFYELANDISRFRGFKAQMKRQPMQSFWAFTTEIGAAIHPRYKDKITKWRDLHGKRFFSGPLPWDVRAHLVRAFDALGIKHEYSEVDTSTVASVLDADRIVGFIIYTNSSGATTAPWITETSLSTEWAALNPSEAELAELKKAGFATIKIDPKVFRRDVHVKQVDLLPFYYGFHVGMEIPPDDVYRMLITIEKHLPELVKLDPAYADVAANMPAMQRLGVAASASFVPIHPGLARYMRERGVWDSAWDSRVASATN